VPDCDFARSDPAFLFDTLRELMTPPEPSRRPIGFVALEEKSKAKAVKAAKKK
jgi:hypothetical protein